MNHSTEGVTLNAGFIGDLLANYKGKENTLAFKPIFEMAKGINFDDPQALAPMKLYNDMCSWIEKNLGPANLRRAGEFVGSRAYDQMVKFNFITTSSAPPDILKALVEVASIMIQDPKKRGWELVESESKRVVMRRTQTFHPVLQEGLLKSMVERTDVQFVRVTYLKSVADGDEFDEFQISWK